jgi:hypothetical protein
MVSTQSSPLSREQDSGVFHPKQKRFNNMLAGKKGMEMWQLVLIILVLILLLAVLAWYGVLGGELKGLFGKLGDLL